MKFFFNGTLLSAILLFFGGASATIVLTLAPPFNPLLISGSRAIYNQEQTPNSVQASWLEPFDLTLLGRDDSVLDAGSLRATLTLTRDRSYYLNGKRQGRYLLLSKQHPLTDCPYSPKICREMTDIATETRYFLTFEDGDWDRENLRLRPGLHETLLEGDFTQHPDFKGVTGVSRGSPPPTLSLE